MPALADRGCYRGVSRMRCAGADCLTKSVSLEASLSTGIMNRKKNIERIANPFAVRPWHDVSTDSPSCGYGDVRRLRGPKQKLQAHKVE